MATPVGFLGGDQSAFRYAMAVEFGRKPGKRPPIAALELWVQRKIRPKVSRKGDTGRARRALGRVNGGYLARDKGLVRAAGKALGDRRLRNEIRSIAFLIARKIGREGTRPQPFVMPAFDRISPYLLPIYREKFNALLNSDVPRSGSR